MQKVQEMRYRKEMHNQKRSLPKSLIQNGQSMQGCTKKIPRSGLENLQQMFKRQRMYRC
jgi:hypothetical protein